MRVHVWAALAVVTAETAVKMAAATPEAAISYAEALRALRRVAYLVGGVRRAG